MSRIFEAAWSMRNVLNPSAGKRRGLRRCVLPLDLLEPRLYLASNPVLVSDINPGSNNSLPQYYSAGITVANGEAYFPANDGTHGTELWKSNGTGGGTVLVDDINPGSGGSYPRYMTNVNGTLFFVAGDPAVSSNLSLWKTDGSNAGTVLVSTVDLGFGPNDSVHQGEVDMLNVNGTLYFNAYDSTHGDQLWKSNGTSGGTVLVSDINGTSGSYPKFLTNMNGTLYFEAHQSGAYSLWKSDGSSGGTTLVSNVDADNGTGLPLASLTPVNNTLFFEGSDATHGWELWKSNGTSAGTMMVKDIYPGTYNSEPLSSFPRDLTNVNGTLFFDATADSHGNNLWKSDGTSAGTVLVKDIGYGNAIYPSRGYLTNVSGELFFAANDGSTGTELWKSNGTSSGTLLVRDIAPAVSGYYPFLHPASSNPHALANVNGTLYFSAEDGTHSNELWRSDGTSAGTVIAGDLTGPGGISTNLANVNGKVLYYADDYTHGTEPWLYDPSIVTTPPTLTSINRSSPAAQLTNLSSVTFLATFSEAVTGVNTNAATDFALTGTAIAGGTIGTPASSNGGLTWSIPVTGLTGNGTVQLNETHATGIANLSGAALTTSTLNGQSYTLDHTAPKLTSINRAVPASATTNGTSVTFLATFSEAVTGVNTNVAADFSLAGTAISGAHLGTPTTANGGLSWSIPVTGISSTGVGTVQVHLGHTTGIADLAGNALAATTFTSQAYTLDHTPPTLVSFNRSVPAGATASGPSVTFLITFSEAVAGVNTNVGTDFSLAGTAVAGAKIGAPTTANGGLSWSIPVSGISTTAAGTVQVHLGHTTGIADLAGNALAATTFTSQAYTLDHTAPTLVSFNRSSPAGQVTSATSVTFLLTFSEAVTGVNTNFAADFSLEGTAIAGAKIATPTTSNGGLTWSIAVTGLSSTAKGTVEVHLGHTTGITDLAGNALAATTFTSQAYTLQHTSPAAQSQAALASPLSTNQLDDYWSDFAAGL